MVTTTSKEIVTIIHTQEVYSETTISICPTPTPSLREDINLMCTTRCPDTTTSSVLSNVAQIGILVTSGVLICLPISALVIVTYCWVRTRRTLKERRKSTGTTFVYSSQDR